MTFHWGIRFGVFSLSLAVAGLSLLNLGGPSRTSFQDLSSKFCIPLASFELFGGMPASRGAAQSTPQQPWSQSGLTGKLMRLNRDPM